MTVTKLEPGELYQYCPTSNTKRFLWLDANSYVGLGDNAVFTVLEARPETQQYNIAVADSERGHLGWVEIRDAIMADITKLDTVEATVLT